ncbi:hypothetical protein ACO0LM_26355 [Undibacterium sp. Di26W]|uniref:hypothetical protein n=1 Tax=Undibacterium sp. Di26W TaxID=3413035 RepID=UPI003BF215FB
MQKPGTDCQAHDFKEDYRHANNLGMAPIWRCSAQVFSSSKIPGENPFVLHKNCGQDCALPGGKELNP